MKNYILCTIEQHRIVRFLPVRGLTTNFLVDGIGVEDNRMTSVKSFLCVWSKYEFYVSNRENLMNWNNKFETIFRCSP